MGDSLDCDKNSKKRQRVKHRAKWCLPLLGICFIFWVIIILDGRQNIGLILLAIASMPFFIMGTSGLLGIWDGFGKYE